MNDQNAVHQLLKIIRGDTKVIDLPVRSIITGKKMRNSLLRTFATVYQESSELPDERLVDVILALDEVIEKEYLTEELLDKLLSDPEGLAKLLKEQNG